VPTLDIAALKPWIGRQEIRRDTVTPTPVSGLAATLDRDDGEVELGDTLPPLWHWLYFLPHPMASNTGHDGHPKKGGFMPPVPLPRRMWAGSRLTFPAPLRVGEQITRVSTIKDISHKEGSSGDLVFVTVLHETYSGEQLAVTEEQDLVYRDPPATDSVLPPMQSAPAEAQWSRSLNADTLLLFRYSALTFNSHRIHYDRDYARTKEGYPGLVVQGPLSATLLLDLLRRQMPDAVLREFDFRAVRPLFDGSNCQLQGRCDGEKVMLWILDESSALTMKAEARLA
jgi:3-methylfumaryl-CoA hydratase